MTLFKVQNCLVLPGRWTRFRHGPSMIEFPIRYSDGQICASWGLCVDCPSIGFQMTET